MKNNEKRYEIWTVEQEDINDCNDAVGNEDYFYDMIDKNVYNCIIEWGKKYKSCDTENEAYKLLNEALEYMPKYTEVFIWDLEECKWFN